MKLRLILAAACMVPVLAQAQGDPLLRGRYLVEIAGCNDCHTPGYGATDGRVPKAQWLTGERVGWRGPWGTTYATNLRLYFASMSEQEWLQKATELQTRPPMPWYSIRAMNKTDLQALYRYIRRLGAAGSPAPEALDPGREPAGPYISFPAPPPAAGGRH